MGQAKQRRAEINQLKALGPKNNVTPFMIRGEIAKDHTVTFVTDHLTPAQYDFVERCEAVINDHIVPQMLQQHIAVTQHQALVYVWYRDRDNYGSNVMSLGGLAGHSPDDAWQLIYDVTGNPDHTKPYVQGGGRTQLLQ